LLLALILVSPLRAQTGVTQVELVAQAALERNYNACRLGYSYCDRTLLTGPQGSAVAQAALERNYNACRLGYSYCDKTLLTGAPGSQPAPQAANDPNFTACRLAFTSCNKILLSSAQSGAVAQVARERNFTACRFAAASCDQSLLTSAQTRQLSGQQDLPAGAACAENGSCYGDISEATGRPKTVFVQGYYRKTKTVFVQGYYRKNGTYVRGYVRSAPVRKP
jgi:hypothetical protein